MDFPRPSKSAGELFGDLKDKLGIGERRDRYDDYDDAFYDDYDDYASDTQRREDDYGYDPDEYGDPYDRLEYTTRFKAGTPARSADRVSSPRLVGARDIRASLDTSRARADESVSSHALDPEPPRPGLDTPVTSFTDFVNPYQDRTGRTSITSNRGYDSLFEPSAAPTAPIAPAIPAVREVSVLAPQSYEDVASVAPSVRSGAIVVLSLRETGADLSKRVLDFSFGVAAALDARVDCVADKTFVIHKGPDLTLEERDRLKGQGVL